MARLPLTDVPAWIAALHGGTAEPRVPHVRAGTSRPVARLTKGDDAVVRDAWAVPGQDLARAEAHAQRSVLAAATVADLLDPSPTVYAAMMRLAVVAARKGRLCGGRGAVATWGTDRDRGGVVSLPVRRDSADDEEAATDAVGVLWARASAGRYGEGTASFPSGRLFTLARNAGRLSAVRRIREHAPLTDVADRRWPKLADDPARSMTVAALVAACPAERRAHLQAKVEAYQAGRRVGPAFSANPGKRALQIRAQKAKRIACSSTLGA